MLPDPEFVSRFIQELDLNLGAQNYENLDPIQRLKVLRAYEGKIDSLVQGGHVSVEDSWDPYFGLLHEYDLLEAWDDRKRVLVKIDTNRYNPLKSSNPAAVMVARIRLQGV